MSRIRKYYFFLCVSVLLAGCVPSLTNVKNDSEVVKSIPKEFPQFKEYNEDGIYFNYPEIIDEGYRKSLNSDDISKEKMKQDLINQQSKKLVSIDQKWKDYFSDPFLIELIDVALKNNQEINILNQEISIAQNEVDARRGEYLPKVGVGAEGGIEKVGEYTSQGASDATTQYEPGKYVPEKLPIYSLGLQMSWEVDIWKKLRNSTKAAYHNYLATIDGKNFMATRIVAEVANTYYELLAYDKLLEIVESNIKIQTEAMELVKLQMQAARLTALAVKRFEAEVLKNKSKKYELKQKIVQTENKLNALIGRLPQPIKRNAKSFIALKLNDIKRGVPSALLSHRPDIRAAEHKLEAAKLNVKVARARFYPSLSIEAGAGYESFNYKHLFKSPGSVFYNVVGNITAPLLNRKGIRAEYFSANSEQIKAVYEYEQKFIKAYTEVINQLSMMENIQNTYILKSKQVQALNDSVEISNILFKAARADYVEVLMTRRDALEAQMELVEIKTQQLAAYVNLYQALGGGWN